MLKRPPKHTNSILSARASTFYLAQQEGKCAKFKCKYSKISYIVNQSNWKKYAEVKKKITILARRLQMFYLENHYQFLSICFIVWLDLYLQTTW